MNIKRYLSPAPSVGGLEINDLALRFLRIDEGKLAQASVQLPPGVITEGKIVDREKLVTALKSLHQQLERKPKKVVHSVLVMPASNVFTQSFSMPLVAEKNLAETARLNMQMISPIDIQTAYSGYQVIGETKPGQLEALASFTNSKDVDDLIAALKEANFDVIAVEFIGLSLTRLINQYSSGMKPDVPYLVVHLSGDGPDIQVIKNGHLYFNYFHSWSAIQAEDGGRKLSSKDVMEFLGAHIKQVLNFYTSRWGGSISNIVIIQNPIGKELSELVRSSFGVDPQLLTIGKYNQLSSLWYCVLGAALRGKISRSKDKDLTLTGVGVDVGYYREAILNFISAWRNVSLLVMGFVAIVLLVADLFLMRASAGVATDLKSRSLVPLSDIQAIQKDVRAFNQGVEHALKAQEVSQSWAPLFDKILSNIKSLNAQTIKIDRLYIDQNFSALIIAKASNDSAVINFKNAMAKEANFQDVVLPLSNIKVNSDGTVSFTLQFKISSPKI